MRLGLAGLWGWRCDTHGRRCEREPAARCSVAGRLSPGGIEMTWSGTGLANGQPWLVGETRPKSPREPHYNRQLEITHASLIPPRPCQERDDRLVQRRSAGQ